MSKFYIAGRIADETDYREKFAHARAEVHQLGHEPISPCDIHDDCSHELWEEWMICDIKAMLDCDGIYALCDWKASKGATVEVQLAMRLNKAIIFQERN
jgi:hypothetical protein